jgi:hypothetical protein
MNNGAAIDQLTFGDQDVLNLVEQILYGYLIPQAWKVSPQGLSPVIM